jgi:ABC-type transport system involved in multi-copper enzyme maturation permease subunit
VLVSLLAAASATLSMGASVLLPVSVWDDVLLGTLRWVVAALPYAIIAFTVTLITRSNAAGIAIGIGMTFAELLVFGILTGLTDGFEAVMEYGIMWNVQQLVNITTDDGGSALDPVSTQQIWQSTAILTFYCVAAVVASYLVFTRRDITTG